MDNIDNKKISELKVLFDQCEKTSHVRIEELKQLDSLLNDLFPYCDEDERRLIAEVRRIANRRLDDERGTMRTRRTQMSKVQGDDWWLP